MSKAVIHGNTVYLCGQVGIRGQSIEDQTKEALNRVQSLLESVGKRQISHASSHHLVKVYGAFRCNERESGKSGFQKEQRRQEHAGSRH
jgi:hypothetical protein